MSELEIRRALTVQESVRGHLKLGSILMIGGVLSEHRLLRVLMDLHGVPAVSWRSLSEASERTVRLLPVSDAVRWSAVAYAAHQQVIGVAFAKPTPAGVAEIAARTGLKVFPGVAPDVRILQAQHRLYGLAIEEPIQRLLAVSDGSTATRLALEELLLLSQEMGGTEQAEPGASSPRYPTVVMRETADEAAPRKKTLRDQVVEALAEFDNRSRAIFGGEETRETSAPSASEIEVVRPEAPQAEPPPAQDSSKPRRKTGFTTDDLRQLLLAHSSRSPASSAPRRKTGFTTADLRELMRG